VVGQTGVRNSTGDAIERGQVWVRGTAISPTRVCLYLIHPIEVGTRLGPNSALAEDIDCKQGAESTAYLTVLIGWKFTWREKNCNLGTLVQPPSERTCNAGTSWITHALLLGVTGANLPTHSDVGTKRKAAAVRTLKHNEGAQHACSPREAGQPEYWRGGQSNRQR